MIKSALLIAAKDLRLVLARASSLFQALILGLILVFVFSLSRETGELTSPQAAATIFWLASVFCQVLIFSSLYGLEESNGAKLGLLLSPAPSQSIWLGKGLCGLLLLLLSQAVFLPACVIFLGQELGPEAPRGLLSLLLTDLGIVALGSLLGVLGISAGSGSGGGQGGRESMLSILLFPLLIPVLLAGIKSGAAAFGAGPVLDSDGWFAVSAAFDAIFLALGLILFPFLLSGDD